MPWGVTHTAAVAALAGEPSIQSSTINILQRLPGHLWLGKESNVTIQVPSGTKEPSAGLNLIRVH